MKNNFKIYILSFFILLIVKTNILASDFSFNALELNILDNGKIVTAEKGTAITKEGNIKIRAEKFEYNKTNSILNAKNGIAFLLEKNIEIEAKQFVYDRDQSQIIATGNVVINDLINNFSIKSENIVYDERNDTIESNRSSTIKDKLGNIIISENFTLTLAENLVKLDNAKIIGVEKDIIQIQKAYINLLTKKIIGKDISIDFNNIDINNKNQPRLKGNAISRNINESVITKGVFTTCKKNDNCPPWQFSAKEIKHNKRKKTIYYKDVWLKIYDQPVFYFPKFFHPDPTVKRQSGFLMPSFVDSSSLGAAFNLPYYHVISNNKDLTLTPRFYSNNKLLAQTEYRQVNKNSEHLIDASIVTDNSAKSHFFSKSSKKLDLFYFDETNLSFQLQQVTNDTYLKTYKIDSPIINDYNSLKSSISIEAYKEYLTFNADLQVYEDLSKENNDRYEYILPNYSLVKKFNIDEKINGSFLLNSSGHMKNYDTNISEKVIINDFIYNSDSKFTHLGFKNSYNFLIKNINTDSKNSPKFKEDPDSKVASLIEYSSSYPLKKETTSYYNILKPMISLRYSPNNNRNRRDDNRRIDASNVFSFNRIGTSDSVEGGASLTYGTEFFKLTKSDKKIFGAKIASVLRSEEDKNLPSNSTLGEKTSDIFGNIDFSPNEIWSMSYEFSQDNNLSDTNFEILKNQISVNNFVTTFEYLNENNTKENQSYLSNKTTYNFNNSNNLSFETREDKKTKLTEFYNLIYQYRNDCLVAALEYNKDYYSDRDLKPNENIFFKLTIIPFGEASSPNLKQ